MPRQHINRVYDGYYKAFQALRRQPAVTSAAQNRDFTKLLMRLIDQVRGGPPGGAAARGTPGIFFAGARTEPLDALDAALPIRPGPGADRRDARSTRR